jgi:hypothetical protein
MKQSSSTPQVGEVEDAPSERRTYIVLAIEAETSVLSLRVQRQRADGAQASNPGTPCYVRLTIQEKR